MWMLSSTTSYEILSHENMSQKKNLVYILVKKKKKKKT